jgi:hypothetical protein
MGISSSTPTCLPAGSTFTHKSSAAKASGSTIVFNAPAAGTGAITFRGVMVHGRPSNWKIFNGYTVQEFVNTTASSSSSTSTALKSSSSTSSKSSSSTSTTAKSSSSSTSTGSSSDSSCMIVPFLYLSVALSDGDAVF